MHAQNRKGRSFFIVSVDIDASITTNGKNGLILVQKSLNRVYSSFGSRKIGQNSMDFKEAEFEEGSVVGIEYCGVYVSLD